LLALLSTTVANMRKWLTLLSVCSCVYLNASGQAQDIALPEKTPHTVRKIITWFQTDNDSSYIEDHTKDITFRLFGSRKYNYYDIVDRKRKQEVLYRPNTPFNIGFGVNYKFLGINIAFNLPFINKENKYGKTRGLDLQSHLYARKMVIDFYGQFYKGYYVADSKGLLNLNGLAPDGKLQVRPDIDNLTLGLGVQYVFNDKKFSYRAAYLQNDYQKKSAGSFIAGAELFGVRMKGDSSLIPGSLSKDDFFNNQRFNRTGIVSLAASAGYAYTFVFKRHFFLTLSLTGSLGANYTSLSLVPTGGKIGKFGLELNNTERISLGYNSNRYFAGIHYMNFTTRSNSPVSDTYQRIGAGDFRISVARRFKLKKKLF
jgi:hypothetical protein